MLGLKKGREMSVALSTPFVAREIADALRREAQDERNFIKRCAHRIGAGPRAIKHWLAGNNPPHAAHLIALMRDSDEVYHTVLRLAERKPADLTEEQKEALRAAFKALGGE